jgi:hypothetical protein
MLVLLVALLLAQMVVLVGLAGGVLRVVFSTDQGIDEIRCFAAPDFCDEPENRPRAAD